MREAQTRNLEIPGSLRFAARPGMTVSKFQKKKGPLE
jgi:hypothetical protein